MDKLSCRTASSKSFLMASSYSGLILYVHACAMMNMHFWALNHTMFEFILSPWGPFTFYMQSEPQRSQAGFKVGCYGIRSHDMVGKGSGP